MNDFIIFDSTKAYHFGKKKTEFTDNKEKENKSVDDLSKDETKILSQVIEHGKNALWSRFFDFMYDGENESPHYKFKLKDEALTKYKEIVKKHHLQQVDLPEYMEDMIRQETFMWTEPLCVNKKNGIWKTVFVFRDWVDFEENGEKETIELRFSLNKIIKGMYEMEILAFGYPIKERRKPKKVKKTSYKKKVAIWRAA